MTDTKICEELDGATLDLLIEINRAGTVRGGLVEKEFKPKCQGKNIRIIQYKIFKTDRSTHSHSPIFTLNFLFFPSVMLSVLHLQVQ